MNRELDAEHVDDESPEWTDEMFLRAKRLKEMPMEHQAVLRGVGRPRREDAKVLISLRLRPNVVEAYRAKGKGWRLETERILTESLRLEETPST